MKRCRALLSSLALVFVSNPAAAFPGFFAYKGAKPNNLSTHVILMKKERLEEIVRDREQLSRFLQLRPMKD